MLEENEDSTEQNVLEKGWEVKGIIKLKGK